MLLSGLFPYSKPAGSKKAPAQIKQLKKNVGTGRGGRGRKRMEGAELTSKIVDRQ